MNVRFRSIFHRYAALIAALAAIFNASSSARASDLDVCSDDRGATKVAACNRVLSSGRLNRSQLPIAYNLRGVGYDQMGQFDLAIADCDTSIRLDPKIPSRIIIAPTCTEQRAKSTVRSSTTIRRSE